jgi:hypothetical protein
MKDDAKIYILSKLEELVQLVPQVRISYEYDSLSKDHLIKVVPQDQYQNNLSYQKFEEELVTDFINIFPFDNLVFLTEDDWIDLKHPDEVFEGYLYNLDLIYNSQGTEFSFADNELFEIEGIEDDFLKSQKMFLSRLKV